MSDLIHVNELIGKLHGRTFKDADDLKIVYSVIKGIEPVPELDVEENLSLKQQLQEALEAAEYNHKLVEEERLKHELYRKDGEIHGLMFAIRCLTGKEGEG